MTALKLERGDVILVHDYDLMERLMHIQLDGIDFQVPLIHAESGNLTKVSISDLRKIVEEYDASHIEAT